MIFNNPELRKLLYKEKSLDDFDIDTEGSIFYLFFEVLLTLDGTKVTDLNIEQKITDMFNDACYISTIALIIKRPALKLGHFRALCNQTDDEAPNDARADEVLCMVYFLLKYCSDRNNSSDSLMSVIDKDLRDRSRESYEIYESFFNACISCKDRIPSGYFNQIVLSPDQFYEDEGEVDWKDLTCTYNKSIIKDIVNCWKDPSQRDIVIDDMAMEVESDYYYHREDGLPLIIYPGERREEMLDYLDSLRLSDKGAENKRKRAQSKEFEKTEKTYSLDDPRIHSYQVPFLLHDENNETIITRTAKEINEGCVNPFNVNWMEVTLYDSTFVTELLEIIHSDFILDVAQAIDDEEARHQREDGQYTDVASNYYGTGQGSANFYSYMINREKEDYDDIAAVTIAHGILKNRIRAEEYQKKLEQRKLGKGATSERNQKALEALAGGGITVAGDLVLEKHVEHQIGNVATGGIGIQIKQKVEAEASKEANKEGMVRDEKQNAHNNNSTDDLAITKESASEMDWVRLTDRFNLDKIKEVVKETGKSNDEKRIVVKAIFDTIISVDKLYNVPYAVDKLIMQLYRKYGGNIKDLSPSKTAPKSFFVTSQIPKEIAESEDWKKLMKAKIINEDGQPTVSRTEAATLADILLERMGKDHEWTLFEKMWGRKNMRVDFQNAQNQVKYESVRKKILHALA